MLGPVTVPGPGPAPGKRARALLAVLALSAEAGEQPTTEELVARVWPAPPPDPAAALDGLRVQLGDGRRADHGRRPLRGAHPTRRRAGVGRRPRRRRGHADRRGARPCGAAMRSTTSGSRRTSRPRPVRLDEERLTALEDRLRPGAPARTGAGDVLSEIRVLVDEHPDPRAAVGAADDRAVPQRPPRRGDRGLRRGARARSPTSSASSPARRCSSSRRASCATARTAPAAARPTARCSPAPQARADPGAGLDDVRPRRAATRGRRAAHRRRSPAGHAHRDRRQRQVAGGDAGRHRVQERFTDVAYLQVTEATHAGQLIGELALALDCSVTSEPADALAVLDPARPILVVLDNLEAIDDGAGVVRRLLDASAALTVLVTSRLPLRTGGEHELPVPPLDVPGTAADRTAIAASASVQLFVDRAASAEPSFRLDGPGARRRRGVRPARRAAAGPRAGSGSGQAAQPRPHHRRPAHQPRPAGHRLAGGAGAAPGDDVGDPLELRPTDARRAAGVRPAGAVRARLHHRSRRGGVSRRSRGRRGHGVDRRRAARAADAEPRRRALRGARHGPGLRPRTSAGPRRPGPQPRAPGRPPGPARRGGRDPAVRRRRDPGPGSLRRRRRRHRRRGRLGARVRAPGRRRRDHAGQARLLGGDRPPQRGPRPHRAGAPPRAPAGPRGRPAARRRHPAVPPAHRPRPGH